MQSNIDIILNAYDKGLKTGLSQAKKEFRDFSSGVNSSIADANKAFTSFGATVSKVISALALYKTGDFVKDTALAAARYETLGVAMDVVGKTAGYSAQQMAWFAQELQKSGISMTESRSTLTKMAQAQLDLSKATQLSRVAQDAAVIGNINSSDALDRMVHGIVSAQTDVLKQIGINVSFEKSYQDVAKATGRVATSFSEQEKLAIRLNAALESGTKIQGVYTAAMETAGKQLTSLTRYYDDFKIKMGQAFGPAMIDLVDAATAALKDMQAEITRPDVQEALAGMAKALSKTIITLGEDFPKAIVKASEAIKTITDVYNTLPSGVVGAAGAGVIGTILFGPQAGAIIGLITLTSTKIDEFKKQHPEIFGYGQPEGERRFKIPVEKPESLAPALSGNPAAKSLSDTSKLVEAQLSAQLDRMKEASKTILLQLEEGYRTGKVSLEKYFADRLAIIEAEYQKEHEVVKKMADAEKTPEAREKALAKLYALEQGHIRDLIKLDKEKADEKKAMADALAKSEIDRSKATSDVTLAELKHRYDLEQITLQEYADGKAAILKQSNEIDRQALETQIAAETNAAKRLALEDALFILMQKHKKDLLDISQEILENEQKTALERAQAIQNMYQAMGNDAQGLFDAQVVLLEEQKKRYEKLMIDQLTIDKWYAAEYKKLMDEKTLQSDDFFAGFMVGFRKMVEEQGKLGRYGFDIFDGVLSNMKTSLGSFVDDAFNNRLKTASEYFQSFAQNIAKMFADLIAEMIARWLMMMAIKGISSIFGGGFSDGGYVEKGPDPSGMLPGYAEGGRIPGASPSPTADNLLIRATAGEFMQPVSSVDYYGTQVMEALRRRMIPKSFFSGFSLPLMPALAGGHGGYAAGGEVSGGFSVSVPVTISGVENTRNLARVLPAEIEQTVIRVMRDQLR
jgi:hypothetical protein